MSVVVCSLASVTNALCEAHFGIYPYIIGSIPASHIHPIAPYTPAHFICSQVKCVCACVSVCMTASICIFVCGEHCSDS